MNQLTNDLSEVADLSAGGVRLDKELALPSQILAPVVEMATPLSQLKNQRLDVDIQPDLPKILVDGRRLEQVLTNMLANAIKYTPTGGTIRACVSHINTGIKIPGIGQWPGHSTRRPGADLRTLLSRGPRIKRGPDSWNRTGFGFG